MTPRSRVFLGCTVLGGVLLLASVTPAPGGERSPSYRVRPFGLADVSTIHVAELGGGDAGEVSRETLLEALRAVGFETAARAEEADAFLGGIVEIKLAGGTPVVVFKTVVLRSPAGETLWHLRLRPARSPGRQAGRVARSLRAGVERAVWEAAREVP
jgi:hypothetical protein